MNRIRLQSYQFFILLALADEKLSGAEVRDKIVGDSLGWYGRDSTLYDALFAPRGRSSGAH